MRCLIYFLVLVLLLACKVTSDKKLVDLTTHQSGGVEVLEVYSGDPDSLGVFESFNLNLHGYRN